MPIVSSVDADARYLPARYESPESSQICRRRSSNAGRCSARGTCLKSRPLLYSQDVPGARNSSGNGSARRPNQAGIHITPYRMSRPQRRRFERRPSAGRVRTPPRLRSGDSGHYFGRWRCPTSNSRGHSAGTFGAACRRLGLGPLCTPRLVRPAALATGPGFHSVRAHRRCSVLTGAVR
jgi:hypothetical protein